MSFGANGRRLGMDDVGKSQASRIDRRRRRRLRGEPRPLGDQEGVSRDTQRGVMVEAPPAAPLIVPKAQFLFQLL